ncbi:hypothetical protein VNO77_18335 [Canavalia gladiata]|uniref:Uncharacterized protein n=1 Tax=Canavalia gladiata TaxID=3824 RepID=A0AAN9LQL0_CANGL
MIVTMSQSEVVIAVAMAAGTGRTRKHRLARDVLRVPSSSMAISSDHALESYMKLHKSVLHAAEKLNKVVYFPLCTNFRYHHATMQRGKRSMMNSNSKDWYVVVFSGKLSDSFVHNWGATLEQ